MKRFAECESGATAVEYGLIAGLLSIALLGGLTVSGESLGGLFNSIAAQVVAALSTVG